MKLLLKRNFSLLFSIAYEWKKILKKRRGDNLLQPNKSHFHLKVFSMLSALNKFLEINCAEITIESGEGIKVEIEKKVFERFAQFCALI